MPSKKKTPIVPVAVQPAIVQPQQEVKSMGLVRMYVWDGQYYQTGTLDSSAPNGKQCLNPDPQSFTSFEQMVSYAEAQGESIQQVTVDQVNAVCSGSFQSGMQGGANAGCCLCQGGGTKNFVPGAGNVSNVPTVVDVLPQAPTMTIQTPQQIASRTIAAARRKPLNGIIY